MALAGWFDAEAHQRGLLDPETQVAGFYDREFLAFAVTVTSAHPPGFVIIRQALNRSAVQ